MTQRDDFSIKFSSMIMAVYLQELRRPEKQMFESIFVYSEFSCLADDFILFMEGTESENDFGVV